MDFLPNSSERLLSLTITLGQYPILGPRIRARMRTELFNRGIIDQKDFETQVRSEAVQTQKMEGVDNPYNQEPPEIWETRKTILRDQLTDLLFSRHLPFETLELMISEVFLEKGVVPSDLHLAINPELAPLDLVFEQALTIENMSAESQVKYIARLEESKVVLIRTLISDQLRYINIAKEWLTVNDLAEIRRRRIGVGRIGGKAAGMLLAQHILKNNSELSDLPNVSVPESFYIGSDELYTFMAINNLISWNDQKYQTEERMRTDFQQIQKEFHEGTFPPDILDQLQTMLIKIGNQPLIVRSSSLLEDNFGTAFAGKYESIFCPNQGTLRENINALTYAIAQVYASVFNPNALLYRRNKGLQDYDERMAILIQLVEGERYGNYLMPHAAGVAFSRNLYRWAPQIRAEDGFVRLVWGLGTRAVDRVGNDYPRLIALSHPLLRPSNDPFSMRRYSQQYVDVIDLKKNEFVTLPVHEILDADYPPLRYIAQTDEGGYFETIRSLLIKDPKELVLTFDELLKQTPFAERMREILRALEFAYHSPVDVEFALRVNKGSGVHPQLGITMLQCRPQSYLDDTDVEQIPTNLHPEDIIFSSDFMVPRGKIDKIDYVIFVKSKEFFSLKTKNERSDLARSIGKLNEALKNERFICVGPGRWGSSNSDLGVPIAYGDIYHAKSLIEMAGENCGLPPEPSLGTHFFQDLLEAQIYPLALQLDNPKTIFNSSFFNHCPNHLLEWTPFEQKFDQCLFLLKVDDYAKGKTITILMNDEVGKVLAYLSSEGIK
ncbi:MAG: PEP/pyruvate-binding domain-containing protein [Chloroflexi bacterium]|nr:PEP/pyruvate-binding domain-containing protein [Chloroflexota bacterium]